MIPGLTKSPWEITAINSMYITCQHINETKKDDSLNSNKKF